MKYLLLASIILFFSCKSSSKNDLSESDSVVKKVADTVFTQIEFKNGLAGVYPPPPVLAPAIRIIKDSVHIVPDSPADGRYHAITLKDSFYYVSYFIDSTHTQYHLIPTTSIHSDWNLPDPYHTPRPDTVRITKPQDSTKTKAKAK